MSGQTVKEEQLHSHLESSSGQRTTLPWYEDFVCARRTSGITVAAPDAHVAEPS